MLVSPVITNWRHMRPPLEPVSPFIEKYHPNATLEEKIQMTQEFRGFVGVLYDLYCKMEQDGRLDELLKSFEDVATSNQMLCHQVDP